MKLSDFSYNLPKASIAKYPVNPRDKAKLLVLDREKQTIETKAFADIADYVKKAMLLLLMKQKFSRQGFSVRKRKPMLKSRCFSFVS